jgi:WD40 repeat protein/tRNA A-37 threonylcarbamoyl transferase component Bud32
MSPAASVPASSLEGRTLGEFTLRDKIGEGGFAVVHRAYQPALDREAVVKILHPRLAARADVLQRFLREARLASRLDHPYAAHVYAFGAEPDATVWIAMEMVHGLAMDRLLETQGPIALERFVPLFERISEVVQTAHERGIVHRDLKPGNVMVMTRAGQLLPKLLDFGIARLVDDAYGPAPADGDSDGDGARTTRIGAVIGSPLYMAPEQWADAASVGPSTDVYALGVLAYEALTGRVPFPGTTVEAVAAAHALEGVPPLGDGLPAALDGVFARALAKQPPERYGSAVELAAALRAASGLGGDAVSLPLLDEALREAMMTAAPQPLAEAVAALEAARNVDQACAILWDVALVVARWTGTLALASRTKIGPGGETDAEDVRELLRAVGRGTAEDDHWLALAQALTRPFAARSDAHPIPELVTALHGEAFIDAYRRLRAMRDALDRRGGKSDEQRRELYGEALIVLADLLRPLEFVLRYTVVIPRDGRCERWRGLRRHPRPTVVRRARPLPDGQVFVLDAAGQVALQLSPLVQACEPAPGKDRELFVYDGKGSGGARMVAIPHGFERTDAALADWFKTHLFDTLDGGDGAVSTELAPYPGLAPFTADDARFYFGREREVEAVVNRLRVEPVLAVVGPSGAGKSSFVQAGVVPRLPAHWRAIVVRPGPSPLAALEARLSRSAVPVRDLAGDPGALAAALRAAAEADGSTSAAKSGVGTPTALPAGRGSSPVGSTIVLVIDQLEELFTLCHDERERQAYAAALAEATRSADEPIRVILTLRDDFLIRAESLVALRDRLARGLKLLTTPPPEDLERILVEPARRAGYQFEDRALVSEMVDAVSSQPGALALLSFTAAELWQLRDRHFHQLSRQAYAAIGGVGGALARHAEAMLGELSAADQRLAREAFRHLVTGEGTRQVLALAELSQLLGGGSRAEVVVDRLIAARLIVVSEEAGGEQRVEIIHEALLTAWPRLVEWRKEDAEGARLRDQLRSAARQWDARGRPKGLLWRGDALGEYRIWRARYPGTLTSVEDAFGADSVADAARGRRLRTAALATVLAAMALAMAILIWARDQAAQQRETARAAAARDRERYLAEVVERARQAVLDGRSADARSAAAEASRLGAAPTVALRLITAAAAQPGRALLATLRGHDRPIVSAEIQRDADRLLTASEDGTAKLWDLQTGASIATFTGCRLVLWGARFSPDGQRIATACTDGMVRIYAASGALERELAARRGGGGSEYLSSQFAPDGRRIVTVGSKSVALWDVATGAPVWAVEVATAQESVAYSPDAAVIATADLDFENGHVNLWSAATGKLLHRLPSGYATSIEFDPTGGRLLTASSSKVAQVWTVHDGKLALTLSGHSDWLDKARFSADGKLIATAARDHSVRIWDAATGALVISLAVGDGRVTDLAFDARRRLLAGTTDGLALLWETTTNTRLATLEVHRGLKLNSVGFAADGARIVTAGDDGNATLWSPTASGVHTVLPHSGQVFGALFAGGDRIAYTVGGNRQIKRWDVATGALVREVTADREIETAAVLGDGVVFGDFGGNVGVWTGDGAIRPLARHVLASGDGAVVGTVVVSPDGKLVASGSDDDEVLVTEAATGRELARLGGHTGNVYAVAFSADSQRVATGDGAGRVWIWGVDGKQLASLQGHSEWVTALRFARDGRLVTVSRDTTARVWSEAGAPLRVLRGHNAMINSLALAPDERRIATTSTDNTARIWDLETGTELVKLQHPSILVSAMFAAGGELLVTTGEDPLVRLWELRTGKEVLRLDAHTAMVWRATFSSDERLLATAGFDGKAVVLALPR